MAFMIVPLLTVKDHLGSDGDELDVTDKDQAKGFRPPAINLSFCRISRSSRPAEAATS
jgi:hypothetical protein